MIIHSHAIRRFLLALSCAFTFAAHTPVSNAAEEFSADQRLADGIIVSSQEPSLAIKVDSSFEYVGRHTFKIRDVAAGERFVFVDAEASQIKRLFLVQFEGFLPEIDAYYRYNLSASPVVAGYPFRSKGYAFDIVDSIAASPVSESAATYPFLEENGYEVPQQWMMWRSLTVVDDAKKKELIIFYVEDVASTSLSLDEFYVNDEASDGWAEIQKGLESRANASFELAELNVKGQPDTAAWKSIPVQLNH